MNDPDHQLPPEPTRDPEGRDQIMTDLYSMHSADVEDIKGRCEWILEQRAQYDRNR